MTDRYENIRLALEMGPTPGPWAAHPDIGTPVGTLKVAPPIWGTNTFNVPLIAAVYGAGVTQPANAALIAACDPDTIRELLAERDQLAAALESAQMGLRYAVRVWVLSDEIKWSEAEIDEVVESIISDAKKEAGRG